MAKESKSERYARIYGPNAGALKGKLSKKQWIKFVKRAHAQGFTVEGAASKVPTAFKERTPDWIKSEASKQVSAGYKGAEKAIDTNEQAAKNLAAKRSEDDQRYADWLKGENDKMDANAAAADALLQQQQNQIASEMQQRYAQGAQASIAAANAAGTGTQSAGSSVLANPAASNRAQDAAGAIRSGTASQLASGAAQRDRLRGANTAFATAARNMTSKGLFDSMADISKQRAALGADKAKDIATFIKELQNNEFRKAQSNRDYMAALGALGVKEGQLALGQAEHDRKTRADKIRARDIAEDNARQRDRDRKKGSSKYTQAQRVEYKKQMSTALSTIRGQSKKHNDGNTYWEIPASGSTPAQYLALTPKNERQIYNRINVTIGDPVRAKAITQQLIYGKVYDGTWQALRNQGINPKGLGLTYGGKVKKRK